MKRRISAMLAGLVVLLLAGAAQAQNLSAVQKISTALRPGTPLLELKLVELERSAVLQDPAIAELAHALRGNQVNTLDPAGWSADDWALLQSDPQLRTTVAQLAVLPQPVFDAMVDQAFFGAPAHDRVSEALANCDRRPFDIYSRVSSIFPSLPERSSLAAYQSLGAGQKQEILGSLAAAEPYLVYPDYASGGFSGRSIGERARNLAPLLFVRSMHRFFDVQADVLRAHNKVFHPFGSVAKAKVVFDGALPESLTGMFQDQEIPAIVRLSMAADADSANGVAVKLLVDGAPSQNVVAIPHLEAQSLPDFFALPATNVIPKPQSGALGLATRWIGKVDDPLVRPLDNLASINTAGYAIDDPVAPYQVFFERYEVPETPRSTFDGNTRSADGMGDHRDVFASIEPGTKIYKMYFKMTPDGEKVYGGYIELESWLAASPFSDQQILYQHTRVPKPD